MSDSIYLDYNTTTPIAPEVREAIARSMLKLAKSNPAELEGEVKQILEQSKQDVANLIGAYAGEILFTGSASESNHLAILGMARASPGCRHLITSAVEHPSALRVCMHAQRQGWDVTIVPVDSFGRVDPSDVALAMREDTGLVSVIHAHHELGTIQPIEEIARITRARGVLFHVDAAQSIGKVKVDVNALGIDALSITGHKFYAPCGIGALYLRQGTPIDLALVRELREPSMEVTSEGIIAIAALGAAAGLARVNLQFSEPHFSYLRDELYKNLASLIPGLSLNGHPKFRLPNTLNVSFPDVYAWNLVKSFEHHVKASATLVPPEDIISGVFAAIGATSECARGAVRFSVGLMTTPDDIKKASRIVYESWDRIRTPVLETPKSMWK